MSTAIADSEQRLRVVRAEGEPGGYRSGGDRKRALLAPEVRAGRTG